MAGQGPGKSFFALTFLALLVSLAGAVLIVAQINPPDLLDPLGDPLRTFDRTALVLAAATVLPLALIIMAYVSSLRAPRAMRRPIIGLYVLGFSLFTVVLAYVATLIDDFFLSPLLVGLAGGAVLLLSVLPRLIETWIGRFCLGLGDRLLRKQYWGTASTMLGMARKFLPSNEHVARDQGLALYALGEAEQALEILVLAYRRGDRDPRLVRTLADSVFQLPEDRASEVLADALGLDPDNAKLGRKLAELQLRRQQPADALPLLEKFHDPDNIEDVCQLGRLHAEQGNVDRALQLARRAMQMEGPPYKRSLADLQVLAMQAPDKPDVLLALAQINEQIGNREEAVSWYLNLLELQPENTAARRHLIGLYRELGRLDQTFPHYRHLLREEPDSPEVALEYAQLLEDREDFDKALKVYQDFASRYPNDYRYAYHSALCLFALQSLGEAEEALERARAGAPAAERARIQSLAAKIQATRVEQELTALRQQAQASYAPVELRLSYIERLVAYGQAEEAVRQIDLLLDQQPREKDKVVRFLEKTLEGGEPQFLLVNILAGIYLKDREFDRCHHLYEIMAKQSLHPDEIMAEGCRQILRLHPNHLPSLKSHSALLVKGGHHREAARVLTKILELSPPARNELLPVLFDVYYKLGDADRAIPYGEELLQTDAQNLNTYLRLRELHLKRDDHQSAIGVVQRALQIAPDNRQLREMLLESQNALKEKRLEALSAQLEQNPDQPTVLHELADLYLEFGRLNNAITAYQRAAQNAEGNLRNLCLTKLAFCLMSKQMYDLADETLRDLEARDKETEYLDEIKRYLYGVAQMFEEDEQFVRALNVYKKLFKIDAGYKDVVGKLEALAHYGH